jgi:hypothetical protein
MKDRKIALYAALIALVCAIPGRREEAGTQLPASEVDKMHAKPFDERSGRGRLLDRAKHEGDLRITIFPQVGMLSANDPTPTSVFAKSITSAADIVVIGVEENSQSFLTENQVWFSQGYVFSINEVIKDNVAHPVPPGINNHCC